MSSEKYRPLWVFVVAYLLIAVPGMDLMAQGGCGAFCFPPDILNPGRNVSPHQRRLSFFLLNEYAHFDDFYEGSDPVTNPGGNSAIINITVLDANVTLSNRWSLDVIVPYVRKTQHTNRFGQRRAEGFGDIAAIGNVLLTPADGLDRLSLRVGFKFATGNVEEPSATNKLPNPFQTGSGAEDFLVGANYFRAFPKFSTYTSWLSRIPLTENEFRYKFGTEHRVQFGAEISVGEKRYVTFLAGLAFNMAQHDRTRGTDVPGRLLDGETVLNTGGNWLDFAPGLRFNLPKHWFVQTRFQVPIHENWNGERSRSVGQVRPGWRWQMSLGFQIAPERSSN